MLLLILLASLVLLTTYLWAANRAISIAPPEALRLAQKPWTTEEIQDAYRRFQVSHTDVTPYLFGAKNRRYIVVGGSGERLRDFMCFVVCYQADAYI